MDLVTFHFHTTPLFKTSGQVTKYIITRNNRSLGLTLFDPWRTLKAISPLVPQRCLEPVLVLDDYWLTLKIEVDLRHISMAIWFIHSSQTKSLLTLMGFAQYLLLWFEAAVPSTRHRCQPTGARTRILGEVAFAKAEYLITRLKLLHALANRLNLRR